MKQLLRTLHSACRIIEQLDLGDFQSLRDNPQYTARLEQLMGPMGHSIASTSQKGQAGSPKKAARPENDEEHQPRRTSIKCMFISSDQMRKSESHSKNPVVSRWLLLVTPKASPFSGHQPVSISKDICTNDAPAGKDRGASNSRQLPSVPRSLPEPSVSSQVSPVKRLDPSDTSTRLNLTQQYEIIRTLLSRAATSWTNAAASSCAPSKDPVPVTHSIHKWSTSSRGIGGIGFSKRISALKTLLSKPWVSNIAWNPLTTGLCL